MYFYIFSIMLLLVAILLRRIVIGPEHKSSINYFLLMGWIIALISDFIYSLMITKVDLGKYAFIMIITVTMSSIISLAFRIRFKKITSKFYFLCS